MKPTKILLIAIFANIAHTEPSQDRLRIMAKNCIESGNKKSCQALIEANLEASVLPNLQSCVKTCNSIGEDNNCYKSCNNVGIIHALAGDYTNAVQYAKQSIKLGNPYPHYWLGNLHYESGDMEALQMLEKSCNANKDKAIQAFVCVSLGGLYLKGRGIFGAGKGVGQNYRNALQYSQKSCDMREEISQLGCYYVAYLYLHGKGIRQDISQAKEYFGKACDLGNQGACERYKQMQ